MKDQSYVEDCSKKSSRVPRRGQLQRTSPQKAKLVLDTIKGLRVEKAMTTVAFTNKKLGPVVEKVLRSAMQNASTSRRSGDWTSTSTTCT